MDCRPSFSPGSFPRQVDGKTLIPDAMLDSLKACHRSRMAVAPICGSRSNLGQEGNEKDMPVLMTDTAW